jgi:sigma-B regulation protein RsbU (phosphoserine phosphatase)
MEVLDAARERVTEGRAFNAFQFIVEPLPRIWGFRSQLELLFYHVIDNAIQFRKPGSELVLKVSSVLLEENIYRSIRDKYKFTEHVKITFSDNGIGFDKQYTNYVFDMVKKLDPTSNGLGVGLSLVKKIVDNHSGSIKIESQPGKGTNVILTLPLNSKG